LKIGIAFENVNSDLHTRLLCQKSQLFGKKYGISAVITYGDGHHDENFLP
jgi:hypothetical protein